ncbi:MAG: BatD family protein, partial [Methanosarcinaceae archaeon]
MIKLNRTLLLVLCSVLFLVMLVGNAYARVEIYNGSITEGDGYQINNFVIDVTDVFVSANTVVFKVYERDELKIDKMINRNDSITFDFDGGEVELRLMSVFSATLPRARVFITVSNYNIANLHANEIINGGHEYATYSGTPVIEIIKTVDKDNITVGDTITVTVTAKNTGDDKATNVIFSDPKQEYFILDKSVLEQNGPMSMDAGTSQTVFVYMLKATDDGTFTLKPSTATFS